ncbi:hypothetical protein ACWDDN_23305 [Streptomyces griseoruber]
MTSSFARRASSLSSRASSFAARASSFWYASVRVVVSLVRSGAATWCATSSHWLLRRDSASRVCFST